jgi:hypothetical protein
VPSPTELHAGQVLPLLYLFAIQVATVQSPSTTFVAAFQVCVPHAFRPSIAPHALQEDDAWAPAAEVYPSVQAVQLVEPVFCWYEPAPQVPHVAVAFADAGLYWPLPHAVHPAVSVVPAVNVIDAPFA